MTETVNGAGAVLGTTGKLLKELPVVWELSVLAVVPVVAVPKVKAEAPATSMAATTRVKTGKKRMLRGHIKK